MEEGIGHRTVAVNGISMHVAEKGEEGRPVVILLHGFPELWYSWRHQLSGLAARGYRAVAPDLRGYGDSDAPPSASSYTVHHLVGDVVALIDHLVGQEEQVFVVGHDWGASVAWHLCMFRPDRVRALVNLSVPYGPRDPGRRPVETTRAFFGDNFYISKFQEPGAAETEFSRVGTALVLRKFLNYFNPGPAVSPKDLEFDLSDYQSDLPSWLSEDDFNYFTSKFEKTGFTGGLNYYRAIDLNWELTAPWTGVRIKTPVKFIVGDLDLTYNFPGVKDYFHTGGFKKDVPFLQDVVVMEGVGHFINQEKAQEITDHIYHFIKKF